MNFAPLFAQAAPRDWLHLIGSIIVSGRRRFRQRTLRQYLGYEDTHRGRITRQLDSLIEHRLLVEVARSKRYGRQLVVRDPERLMETYHEILWYAWTQRLR